MVTAAEAVDAGQPTCTAADAKRAREIYKYLQPSNLIPPNLRRRESTFDGSHNHIPSLSDALSPYCQLTALRCNARKAMLNVMDRDVMYFLAEACRVPSCSGDLNTYEFVDDPVLIRCSAVPLSGRICEMTLRVEKKDGNHVAPMFVIPNLEKSQFADLDVVRREPGYKFYAGTPITTRDGINIGSLAIMDTSPRLGLTVAEEEFLTKTAAQIMIYLETNRQAIEGRRSMRMAEGIESFIAGKGSIVGANSSPRKEHSMERVSEMYGISLPMDAENEFITVNSSKRGLHEKRYRDTSLDLPSTSEGNTSHQSTAREHDYQSNNPDDDSRSHSKTFARAANLIREAFGELGDGGNVVFVTLKGTAATGPPSSISQESHDDQQFSPRVPANKGSASLAPVLALSTATAIFNFEDASASAPVIIDECMLRDLIQRYPGGNLWTFDDVDGLSAAVELNADVNDLPRGGSQRNRTDEEAIRAAFPNARQVLFNPVWDSNIGAFAHAVFVSAVLETRSLTFGGDLPYLNSFCSTVMAECSRLDTMKADKQKSDFVGTISHEMRSPLHGILASVEFLADTDLNPFQQSLVDTVDSCGRTLLDTINHVLDFSKVNTFQKHWQTMKKRTNTFPGKKNDPSLDKFSKTFPYSAPPLLQLFAVTDISAVLEEVVDGLVLGHTYASGVDLTDLSREARGRGSAKQTSLHSQNVEVVIDVQKSQWVFMTQPGAVRRVVMNIVGNALKYTPPGGFVTVSLELQTLATGSDDKNSETMVLTVVDTGCGISPQFLSSKLFVPFAQENSLAPGTGLGLSIVNSIVTMLGGSIDIKSQLGKGTTVQVILPLKRPLPGQQSTSTTPSSADSVSSGGSDLDESVSILRNQAHAAKVALYLSRASTVDDLLGLSISRYVTDWYGLELLDQQNIRNATVVITEEKDLESLIQQMARATTNRPAIVVMCRVMSRQTAAYVASLENRIGGAISFVSQPCGPYKLAKSIRIALEKIGALQPRLGNVTKSSIVSEISAANAAETYVKQLANNLQEIDLNSPGHNNLSKIVQANEVLAASQISQNAQMAIISPTWSMKTPTGLVQGDSYPFPDQTPKYRASEEQTKLPGSYMANTPSTASYLPVSDVEPSVETTINPRILLVDDNKINLTLLETFLKTKRQYTRFNIAENGREAVDAFTEASEPYEIIFMDISMPVMNGFEATRCIRQLEKSRKSKRSAMIIALTGLASSRDQSEGFDSGCDIYMTKPVRFKEVGKLLDNWEAHQRLKEEDGDGESGREQKQTAGSSIDSPHTN